MSLEQRFAGLSFGVRTLVHTDIAPVFRGVD